MLVHHRRVYKDAKCTWGQRLWIKGWTSDAISRISESDNANLAMESIFRAEVSKFKDLPSSICCAVTAFEQWKGFYRSHMCTRCNLEYAMHQMHHCENNSCASRRRTFDNLKLIVQIYFIEKYGVKLQLP